jgi:hypothetical protein
MQRSIFITIIVHSFFEGIVGRDIYLLLMLSLLKINLASWVCKCGYMHLRRSHNSLKVLILRKSFYYWRPVCIFAQLLAPIPLFKGNRTWFC